ncbi:hypothetical protein [Terasakiella pusilla]|jgi:hypothetical protein|uniref:hypothetical protein n=1 Tax=Terasakiella pusilla TaxID=64973 RepID=UPI00048F29E5|nr:hypothetical protein [Terasakiella pusilla]
MIIRKILLSLTLVTTLLTLAACKTMTKAPVANLTQLEIRQLQTRLYDTTDLIAGLKATAAALQDEGFIISNVNETIGIITGQKVYMLTQSNKVTENASASVALKDNQISIRLNLASEEFYDGDGGWGIPRTEAHPIYDPAIYEKLFSKVDKSLFLRKENISVQ